MKFFKKALVFIGSIVIEIITIVVSTVMIMAIDNADEKMSEEDEA